MSNLNLVESPLSECPMCEQSRAFRPTGPGGAMQCPDCGGFEPLDSVIWFWYLTDAAGYPTTQAGTALSEEDFAKVAFEAGPGVIRTYLAEDSRNGQLFVLGVLETSLDAPGPWNGPFEGEDGWYQGIEEAARQADMDSLKEIEETVGRRLRDRLPGALVTREHRGFGANVVAAIPISSVSDSGETWDLLADVFGEWACTCAGDRTRLQQPRRRRPIVESVSSTPAWTVWTSKIQTCLREWRTALLRAVKRIEKGVSRSS